MTLTHNCGNGGNTGGGWAGGYTSHGELDGPRGLTLVVLTSAMIYFFMFLQ